MVSFHSITAFSLYTLGALAAPAPEKRWAQCLTRADAQQVATNYGNLIASYTEELAAAALTSSFTDFSESVNTLIDSCPEGPTAMSIPLMNPTFSNLTEFEAGQGHQSPIDFDQLQLWYSCDSVTIRWMTTNVTDGTDVKPVTGLIVMETTPAPTGNEFAFQIDTVYSEFDSGAWLQNLQAAGMCGQSTTPPVPSSTTI